MKNHHLVKCYYCNKEINKSKATTDIEHEFVRFISGEVYFHKKDCFQKYEEELHKTV